MTAIKQNLWTIVFALISVFAFQGVAPALTSWYQRETPVVDMVGTVVLRSDESVLIHITGEKLRMCTFVRMSAMTIGDDGIMVDAYLEKMGKPSDGATKPTGSYDIGSWKVWPISGASKVIIFVQHDCSGEVVLSRVAEVAL